LPHKSAFPTVACKYYQDKNIIGDERYQSLPCESNDGSHLILLLSLMGNAVENGYIEMVEKTIEKR